MPIDENRTWKIPIRRVKIIYPYGKDKRIILEELMSKVSFWFALLGFWKAYDIIKGLAQ